MKNHSFDDLLKQKALQHEAPVPDGTWEAIAPKKKKRRFIIFWWITGVALLSGFILWQSYLKDSGRNAVIASTEVKNKQQVEKKNTDIIDERNDTKNNDNNTEIVVNKVEETGQNNKGGAVTSPGIQKESALTQDKKTTSLALPGSAKKDKRSSSALVISTKQTATISDNSVKVKRAGKENSAEDQLQVVRHSFINDNLSPPDFKMHSKIAKFDSGKDILLGTSDINSLITNKADSMNAITSAMAIDAKKRIRRNKWTIEASVMPFLPVQQDQSLLYITRTDKGDMHKYEFKTDKINTRLQSSLAYTIAVYKKINPRLRIGAGIQYAMVKEKVDLIGKETRTTYTEVQRLENGTGGPQLITDTAVTTSTGTLTIDALNSYKFISIPVSVQYTLMQRRAWALQVNGGILMNISSTYHNSIAGDLVRVDNRGIHTGQQRSAFGVDLLAGLRVSRSYGPFRLFAEPMIRYNTRRYDLGNMISKKYMHQAGLSFGISYLFSY
jgi:hypothetical protein